MTKKSKLIIGGSVVLGGSIITGIAVPLSLKANEPILEEKQEEQQQDDDSKKTEEKNGQAEANKQQVDSPEEKQQNSAESGSGEKAEENNGQVDSQKDSAEEKQKDDAEATSGEKAEENSEQTETNKQEIDSPEEKQQNSVESGSGEKAEENNKATEPMKSQVNSQASDTQKQQNEVESKSSGKVEKIKTIETSEQKGKELESKLIPDQLYFQGNYFFLKLKASKTLFDKIKNDRLKFRLDKGDATTDEQASSFYWPEYAKYYYYYKWAYEGENVLFEISSEQQYGIQEDEKGRTYKVTKVWLSNDPSETNLLNKDSDTVEVK